MRFSIIATDTKSKARVARLELAHATLETPLFMPCATLAVVRACDTADLEATGVQMICCNAYHLWQRPGE